MGDENDIDTGTVHLGMKLTTGMNQEIIFSDLIEDKKIYNFGIETFEPVTVEENSNLKIQVVLNGGELKKRTMTASLQYHNIATTGTILSKRMLEFPTELLPSSLNDLKPNDFKITISSKEILSKKWSKTLVPSGDWEKKPKKRNTAAIPEPECSIKSAKFDDVQSDLIDIMDEEWRSNPNIFEYDPDYLCSPLIKDDDDILELRKENQELRKENYELRRENDDLRKRLNEKYHSVTASDVVKQFTNNEESVDDKIDIIITEDFKKMRVEQKAFWQYVNRFPLNNNFRFTIAPKYNYSIEETFMDMCHQLSFSNESQFLPKIIDKRKELSEAENVGKLAPNGEKEVCWQKRSPDDFGSPIIFRHTGIWSKFMANSFFEGIHMNYS